MAIFRFEAKIISRNGGKTSAVGSAAYQSGKCATSAAAYRAGEQMVDARTGQAFDYSKKQGVLGAEIILPAGAPAWMEDRSLLWNAVEAREKRKDAQLARDFIISLPHELTHEQRRELLREFVQTHLTARGYVADCAYHAPPKEDGLNWHAHVMVPLRRVTEEGFAARKERPEGNPFDAWKTELAGLREDWAATVNRHLEAAGSDARVDHRSNAAQGLDREPEPKLGPIAAKIEAEGRESHAGNDLRDARARNAERGRLKGELAATTAEIIDLQLERIKRVEKQAPELDPATYSKQRDQLLDRIRVVEAQANYQAPQHNEATQLREEMNRRNSQQAEEAKKHAEDIKQQQQEAAANGDITDPALRYAQALGNTYSARDPYGSLAAAAMAEYGAFARQQQELKFKAHAEQDPQQKRIIELQAKIEGADYMAITHRRLGGMGDVIAGQEHSAQGERDRAAAAIWKEHATTWREERAELMRQQRDYEQGQSRDRETANTRDSTARQARDNADAQPGRERSGTEQTDRGGERSDRQQGSRNEEHTPRESGDRQQSSPEQGEGRAAGTHGRGGR